MRSWSDRSGRFEGIIECKVHGLKFSLDGRRADAEGRVERAAPIERRAPADMSALDLQVIGGLLLVRSPKSSRAASLHPAGGFDGNLPHDLIPIGPALETSIAADWKVLVEQWLESATFEGVPHAATQWVEWSVAVTEGARTWSTERYGRLAGEDAHGVWRQRFIAPNQLLQFRPDGLSILQVMPTAPGRCRLRRLHLSVCASGRSAQALQYAAGRISPFARPAILAMAESVQTAMIDFGYRAASGVAIPPAVAWFRAYLTARVPALSLERPPADA